MLATLEFAEKAYIAAACCMAFGLALVFWSRHGVRQGKPAIPPRIIRLSTLGAFLTFLFFSAPLTYRPQELKEPWQRRSAKEDPDDWKHQMDLLRSELGDVRRDLHQAEMDLDLLNGVVKTMLILVLYAMVGELSGWLAIRTDDRNWIHGGIRPPPEKMPPEA